MGISFNNIETAFASKSTKELKTAYWLFRLVGSATLVNFGNRATILAMTLRLPISWLFTPIFKHFCGGKSIDDCELTIKRLSESNIGTILDYAAEGIVNEKEFDKTTDETIRNIEKAASNKSIPFSVFKVTGLARFELLEKIQAEQHLTGSEKEEFTRVENRIKNICEAAYAQKVHLLIDAEESWIQDIIDKLVLKAMQTYNKEGFIIFNTLQLYRHDRLAYLLKLIETGEKEGFKLGVKIVRGAYMEKERERAKKMNYLSPIHSNKDATDKDFDSAIKVCIDHINSVAVCVATHNEQSNLKMVELMEEAKLANNNPQIYSAQLLGMSDNITYNLSKAGYNTAKYVPYGPVKTVIPYLLRRATENTSVAGQTSRELKMISEELKRRKLG